ncbi:ammonium transporter [Streptococcus uberis]|uniref:ammonium transporter n=1 Tax=Streptococcus uberis TaxID=1349 RepID=UPI00193B87A0|nr:ammonium transporter [Streptococcus uberis]
MFICICILVMWLMIFGVASYYFASLNPKVEEKIIYQFVLMILISTLTWIAFVYNLCLGDGNPFSFFQKSPDPHRILDLIFQLCFCLYAVVMLFGSVIDRISSMRLTAIVVLWILFVYGPLVYLFWNPKGILAILGVKDFSGGMVVHLSAGLSSLILAKKIGKSPYHHQGHDRIEWQFISMVMISLGWFGFNMGPAGSLNDVAIKAFLNTLIAICCGGLTWALLDMSLKKVPSASGLLNGILVGLVSSTAGVGYVQTIEMAGICTFAVLATYLVALWFQEKSGIDDVVDSFVMNGIGGLTGSLLVIVYEPKVLFVQLLALFITIILSTVVTVLIWYLTHIVKI